MEQPIISVSGLRGIIGRSLGPLNAIEYIAAFSSQLAEGPVVVTRDGRTSGPMLADAIASALVALGRDVLYGDVAATPTAGVLVRSLKAAGGIQISASHNPPEYNGIKLFGPDGRVISAAAGERIMSSLNKPPAWVGVGKLGKTSRIADTTTEHLRLVLDTVDVPAIRKAAFNVVLDSNHGSGGVFGRLLLQSLGARVFINGEEPSGRFAHSPEPTRENLQTVSALARDNQADIVFCQDPDADRLAIIADDGSYPGEEYTLALTMMNRLSAIHGNCVINCATSRMSIDVAERAGSKCFLSAVGEANVCDRMMELQAVYGGEGNGGPIDPRVGYVRDSFVAMAQVLELMAKTGKSIRELIRMIPAYSIIKDKAEIDRGRLPAIYASLEKAFPDAVRSDLDGIRFDWPDRWLLVRPSNTEPIVRVICEAVDERAASELAALACKIVRQ
jgi:phosphomannomutase